ncbi:MAG: AAA family ATPase [Betaproteobacteria bacterium]|nr:AAA family ATPase [Betaproteobacteria bacterium]
MKIERVRPKNFGGVDEAEVSFSLTGATLIHGPNESGKSTLAAESTCYSITATIARKRKSETQSTSIATSAPRWKPMSKWSLSVHLFKRFHKDKETVLTIHAPKAESLSGREAHDRVLQILDGSVDTGLWQALSDPAGRNLEMPALHDQRALSEALDRAAGQAKSGDKENALFEAAYAEYGQYYTETGREREIPLGQTRTRAAEATAKEQGLQSELSVLEADVTRHASLEKSLATLKRGLAGLDAALPRPRRPGTPCQSWLTV